MTGKINAAAIIEGSAEGSSAIMKIVSSDATKSSKIRALDAMKVSRATIANLLTAHYYPKGDGEVRYQHVRNVLVTKIAEPTAKTADKK